MSVIFNPSNRQLECYNKKNLRNINDIDKNGYKGFIKILNEKFDTDDKNIYYWLFNNENDIININEYKNLSNTDSNRYIQILLSEIIQYIYHYYIKIIKEIKNNPDIYSINKVIRKYQNLIKNSELDLNLINIF